MPSTANERTPLLSDAQEVAQQIYPDLLHLAKIIGAIQAGKLPSNAQLGRALDRLTDPKSSVLSPDKRRGESKLSESGQTLLADIRQVLLKLRAWAEAKNKGDVLQELVFHAKNADVFVDADADLDIKKPASSEEVQRDANDLKETFQTLARLVFEQANVLSAEAKDTSTTLSGDIILVVRDLLADAAEEVSRLAEEASKDIRPEEGEQGSVPSKEDLKKKGKQVQSKAEEEAGKGKARLEKDVSPAQDKAVEYKDKAVDRLIQVANRIQKDPAYKKAFNQVFSLARKYYKKTGEAVKETAASVSADGDVKGNEESQQALQAFKQLLSNLANGKSLDPLIEKGQTVLEDIKNDERLQKLVDDAEMFLEKLVSDPDYAASKAPKRDAGKLIDRAQETLKENAEWKKHSNELLKELEDFGNAIKDDKQGKELAAAMKKLGEDSKKSAKLGINMFKGQAGAVYRDFANVIFPRVLGLLKEVPIPRTEYKSKDVEFVIDNFTINSVSFVPDNLVVTNHSEFRATRVGKMNAEAGIEASTRVRFDGLRFAAKDVSFWVRRPGAILLSEERGLLDFSLTGKGLSGDLGLALADGEDDETYFKVAKSSVNLSGLHLKIHDNYHWILSSIFTPLLKTALKVSLQSVLSKQIADAFEFLDWRAFDVHRRAQRYETQGYQVGQAYAKALYEPPPSASSGPSALAGVHATKMGFVRDDRGPRDAQIAIGGEQLLPGHSGPRSSIDRASNKAKKAVNDIDRETGAGDAVRKAKANQPTSQDVDRAKKQTAQLQNIVREEFSDAQDTADAQRRAEDGDETWKSDVFNL